MKEKLLALLVVSVMVASAFGAVGLSATKVGAQTVGLNTTKVGAQAGTTVTLSSTNYYPSPGQQYTLSGSLSDSAGNAYKPIEIWYRPLGDTTYHHSNTLYTGANGKYSTTTSSSQTIDLRAVYCRDGCASSNVVRINVQGGAVGTQLTLSSTNYYPSPGQQYTLSGYLRDPTGKGLAYKPIDIYYHVSGRNWQYSNTLTTSADGKYSTTTSSSKTVYLQTGFKGDGGYKTSSSNVVTINVQGGVGTQLSLTTSTYNPSVGQAFTLAGRLTTGSGVGIGYEPIDIWYHWAGENWGILTTVRAGADGKYSQDVRASSTGTITFQTGFKGEGGYKTSSSNVVSVNVV